MTAPALMFGALLATLLGTLFHVWRGGGPGKLLLYCLISWAGFWAGHVLGNWFGWRIANLGPLNLGMAVLGALAALALGYWLSLIELSPE